MPGREGAAICACVQAGVRARAYTLGCLWCQYPAPERARQRGVGGHEKATPEGGFVVGGSWVVS